MCNSASVLSFPDTTPLLPLHVSSLANVNYIHAIWCCLIVHRHISTKRIHDEPLKSLLIRFIPLAIDVNGRELQHYYVSEAFTDLCDAPCWRWAMVGAPSTRTTWTAWSQATRGAFYIHWLWSVPTTMKPMRWAGVSESNLAQCAQWRSQHSNHV
jgi:hypothetical protein